MANAACFRLHSGCRLHGMAVKAQRQGKFALSGGSKILVDGVQPNDVLYNVIGTGDAVQFSGGGGGVNCCNTKVDGTLLAPKRQIQLSPGLVNGAVISGKDISIVSGASVRCPPPPPCP
jgi:hypothetical protein